MTSYNFVEIVFNLTTYFMLKIMAFYGILNIIFEVHQGGLDKIVYQAAIIRLRMERNPFYNLSVIPKVVATLIR